MVIYAKVGFPVSAFVIRWISYCNMTNPDE